MEFDDRINLQNFEGETTYNNDYRHESVDVTSNRKLHKWHSSKIEKLRPRDKHGPKLSPYKSECHESYQTLRDNVYVPFNMLWSHNPIIGKKAVDRRIMEKPVDHGKETSIRNRPRLYVSPAVSIDDVPDKEMRDLLLNYMYTTDWKNAAEEAANYLKTAKSKKKGNICCCKTEQVKLKGEYNFMVSDMPRPSFAKDNPELFPKVSANLRSYFGEWDRAQSRASVDPTTMFWTHTDRPKNIVASDGLVPNEVKENIAKLIDTDEIRLAHDTAGQGYTGYRPAVATGVPLQKTRLPMCHPLLTTSQAMTSRLKQ